MVLIVLLALILGVVANMKVATLNRKLDDLKAQLSRSSAGLAEAVEPTPIDQGKPVSKKKASKTMAALENAPLVLKEPAKEIPVPKVEPAVEAPFSKKPERNVEQALASRWFVWIGGIAIAIGGLLFVKYAFDNKLVSPALQIIMALLGAAILVFAGERLHIKPTPNEEVNYVPTALSAAGIAIAFAAIFAAYALYGLVSPGAAFIGLILVGLGGLALSLRQGPMIAALGLAGSYVTPTLVQTSSPNAWTFFPFLLIIMAASFAVLRKRSWWWLGYACIAGSAAWAGLWMHGPFVPNDVWPVGLFSLAFGALSFAAIKGLDVFKEGQGSLINPSLMSPPLQTGAVGAATASLVLCLLVFKAHHALPALWLFCFGMAVISAFSWFKRGESGAVLAAAVLTCFTLFSWPEAGNIHFEIFDWRSEIHDQVLALRLLYLMFFAGIAFTAYGLAGFFTKLQKLNWAVLAAVAPIAYFGGAWLQVDTLVNNGAWASAAVITAIVLLGAAYLRKDKLEQADANLAAGLLCASDAIALVFAADRIWEGVWLSIAIAVLAFGFAGLTRVMPVRLLGAISGALASLVAARLFASRELWMPTNDLPLGQHWPLYGYGIPIVLFLIASRILKSSNNLRATTGLEAISLGLAISLVSLELRNLIGGGVNQEHMTLLELSTHILAWMGAAFGLVYRQNIYSSIVSRWGSRILLGASCGALILLSMSVFNPIWTGDVIEGGPVFNTLMLAYLAPVIILILIVRVAPAEAFGQWRSLLGALALLLVVNFVTLEVKRLFQGPQLVAEFLSDAESYAMSAAWLVLAIALFILGLRWDRKTVRYGGLAVMILALFKTFGYDLWQLGGLWQIASVMGIGLSLVGMGWLYTRFIRPVEKGVI